MASERDVGLFGLGLMGEALTARLVPAGFRVVGHDIDPAKTARLATLGGVAAASPAEVTRCVVVVLAVFSTDQVEDVVENTLVPAAGPGTVVLCTSTCDPDRIAALAGRVAGTNIRFLETPVSGTSGQVRRGEGVGLIGGDPATAEAVKPVLDALFPHRFHIGKAGDGGPFAGRLGLDLAPFLEVARASAAYSQCMDTKGRKMVERDFKAEGWVRQSLKDFHLMRDLAQGLGQKLPALDVNVSVLEACVAHGEGDLDNSAVIEEIRRRRT
jgi:3-hydroxyisobutyrate dehydrogenase-like beta-hydroxyacid dehydrogenase